MVSTAAVVCLLVLATMTDARITFSDDFPNPDSCPGPCPVMEHMPDFDLQKISMMNYNVYGSLGNASADATCSVSEVALVDGNFVINVKFLYKGNPETHAFHLHPTDGDIGAFQDLDNPGGGVVITAGGEGDFYEYEMYWDCGEDGDGMHQEFLYFAVTNLADKNKFDDAHAAGLKKIKDSGGCVVDFPISHDGC